ncbi:DGQHR domain-containing protein [Moritella sp. F3]|uniref:DGQHR domain-containing protein n=1 Tax=Moritella sp. F3 TaxID=2718882 RepID=UPI0018E1819F|nr:DGQHR domain-containing protein [Moritella sp. F3]GIC77629.1 hypothetical protein FMO001_23560 [Moritella sp. F1]GIC82042.1 hypothetical protein FMO003_23230 [Moritella sp. F3]
MVNTKLNIPSYTISANDDLAFPVFEGIEGIGFTYSAKVTYAQCVALSKLEDESIPERERNQRNAEKSRMNAIADYLIKRDNTLFGQLILVVTELQLTDLMVCEGISIKRGVIPAFADRLFIDGQHRVGGVGVSLISDPSLASRHMDLKIIVVPTATIRESSTFVRQMFSDINSKSKKTNKSQNLHFDSESSLSRFCDHILDITTQLGAPFQQAISRDGKIKHGQLYNFASVSDFVSIMIGISGETKINDFLADQSNYDLYLVLISQYFTGLYAHLEFEEMQNIKIKKDWKHAIDSNVLTCVIGLKALAYVGRSLVEDALIQEKSELDLSALKALNKLPLNDTGAQLWLDKQVYSMVVGKVKIVKSSEKRLALTLCQGMRVIPCGAI